MSKGIYIPDITVEMFRNACLETVEEFMVSGEMRDIDLEEMAHVQREQAYMQGYADGKNVFRGTCETCKRSSDYCGEPTRCPIEEHYALPKDGFCHLWEAVKK